SIQHFSVVAALEVIFITWVLHVIRSRIKESSYPGLTRFIGKLGFIAAFILRSSKKEKLRKAAFSSVSSSEEPITSTATLINKERSTATKGTNTDESIAILSSSDVKSIASAATLSQTESRTMTEGTHTENSTMEEQIVKDATSLIEDLAFWVLRFKIIMSLIPPVRSRDG
ncbi:hypothetical protein DPMN_048609, partial [Dreissena polymorpha]